MRYAKLRLTHPTESDLSSLIEMRIFNSVLNSFFDLFLSPFQTVHPVWPLLLISFLTGILLLVIFRYTSNQKGIGETRERIKAHLLEIRIFKDDPRILLSAQKEILLYNAKYLMYGIKPLVVMVVPVTILLIHLDSWFGYRPLRPGESTVVSVKLAGEATEALANIGLHANQGLSLETPALRIPAEREADWRIRATKPGQQAVEVTVLGQSFRKSVVVSENRLEKVSRGLVLAEFWKTLLHPDEQPIKRGSLVARVDVDYPTRSISIFGWKLHWMWLFFISSTVFGFVFKGLFKVQI